MYGAAPLWRDMVAINAILMLASMPTKMVMSSGDVEVDDHTNTDEGVRPNTLITDRGEPLHRNVHSFLLAMSVTVHDTEVI